MSGSRHPQRRRSAEEASPLVDRGRNGDLVNKASVPCSCPNNRYPFGVGGERSDRVFVVTSRFTVGGAGAVQLPMPRTEAEVCNGREATWLLRGHAALQLLEPVLHQDHMGRFQSGPIHHANH